MAERDELIQEILQTELEMFLSVQAREPVSCQQDPEGFRMNRAAQFSVWSEQTLASYREDLEKAVEQDRNLMTLKYARMEDIIPKLHDDILVDNLIDQIVVIQVAWQKEMMARYPFLMKRGRPLDDDEEALQATSFVSYLRGELETYSADTLAHLYRDVTESQANDQNMTQAIYESLVKSHGYASIEEAEKKAELQARGTKG
jgi:hypothetical protein